MVWKLLLAFLLGILFWLYLQVPIAYLWGQIVGAKALASGRRDSRELEALGTIADFMGSDKPMTPRIRQALQALVDRIEEPVTQKSVDPEDDPEAEH